jgi:hypothetical protein
LLTLYSTPVIYLTFDKWSRKIMAWPQRNEQS